MPELRIFSEPRLEFRSGQGLVDPHDGLLAFGPFDADQPSQPKNISIVAVGTYEGIDRLKKFSSVLRGPLSAGPSPRLWPFFPGFEAAFSSSWSAEPAFTQTISRQKLSDAARQGDPNRRVAAVVDLYLAAIEVVKKRDESFDMIICVVPDFIHKYCRPLSRVDEPLGETISPERLRQRRIGQLEIFEQWDPDIYDFSVDFRNQMKARSMAYGIPIQIIRESTLQTGNPETQRESLLTPLSDRAWNLSVAAYYKSGGKPWRLMSARDGVCYVGLAYRRRDPKSDSRTACCAAQMFLDSGDGIVFLGETGPWYSPIRKQFHLSPAAAKRLLSGVLTTYRQMEGKQLTEIFLHSHSGISRDEFEGFREACPDNVKLVGVRVAQERVGSKLYREGTRPVLRGTFWQVADQSGYLWASGFKPRLGTYDGLETPVPLRIDVQHGDAEIELVARDVLSLTKLNYNACKLGDAEPVTIGFSKEVGEILVTNPAVREARPQFKFYI